MVKKIILTWAFLVILFGLQGQAIATTVLPQYHDIEVFDLMEGKIVAQIPNSMEIQKEITLCLHSMDGLTPQMYFEPEKGVMLTIPMEPSIIMNNNWYSGVISEVYLYLSPSEKPQLLLFSNEDQSYRIHFKHDLLSVLLNLLNHSGLRMANATMED